MKKIVLLIGILLGIAGSSLYFWMKPQTDDPYFFLSPKIIPEHPVSMPIELYKQGATVDFLFWMTPLPQQKYLYLFPANNSYSTYVELDIDRGDYKRDGFYTYEIFEKEGLVELKPNTPLLKVTLYKVNPDLTEVLVTEEVQLYNSAELYRNFLLLSVSRKDYGQYRLKVAILGDWPELNRDGYKYFIKISTFANK